MRAGASRPQPAANLPADRVELTDVAVGERPQPRPDRGRGPQIIEQRRVPPARSTSRSSMLSAPDSIPASTVAVLAALFTPVGPGTVNAAPATSGPSDQRPQPDPFGEHRSGQQAPVRHQVRLIEALRHSRERMRCFHRADAPWFGPIQPLARPIVPGQRAFAVSTRRRSKTIVGASRLSHSIAVMKTQTVMNHQTQRRLESRMGITRPPLVINTRIPLTSRRAFS